MLLQKKVVFHQRLSSIKGCLPLKVIFHQRLSSITCRLPSKGVFHQNLLPSKVVFHHRSSSIVHQMVFIEQNCLDESISAHFILPWLVSANSVQLNWAQAELGKNKLFWESSLWLAIWETSWWKFRQLVRLHQLSRLTLLFTPSLSALKWLRQPEKPYSQPQHFWETSWWLACWLIRLIRLNIPSILNLSFLQSLKVCFLMIWRLAVGGSP